MMTRASFVFAVLTAGLFAASVNSASAQLSPPAQTGATGATPEDERVHFYVGVRTWINRWDIPFAETTPILFNGAPALRTETKSRLSGTEIVPMPTAGVSYGRWSASATFFPHTDYDSKGALATDVGRREFDVNIAYAILPSRALSVSVGYKEGKQDRLSSQFSPSGTKVRGVLLGLSAGSPLTEALSWYGNFAYGFAREKTDFVDIEGKSRFDADYQIGELGLSYSLGKFLIQAGYRFQALTAKGILSTTTSVNAPFTVLAKDSKDVRTYTTGPTISLIAFF